MRLGLKVHPDSLCAAVTAIDVEAVRPRPSRLLLRYRLAGQVDGLRLPVPAAPLRADGLWRHTCFEAFLRAAPGRAYYEFNFAPSTRWAAYRFDDYRSGMTVADEMPAPHIEVRSAASGFELEVSLDLDELADLPADAAWRLGVSAVVEEAAGGISYWALAHPPGRPDFHQSAGFVHELGAPPR